MHDIDKGQKQMKSADTSIKKSVQNAGTKNYSQHSELAHKAEATKPKKNL